MGKAKGKIAATGDRARALQLRGLARDQQDRVVAGQMRPTAEREQHGTFLARETFDKGVRSTVRVLQSPLERLLARTSISKRQFMAGDRFCEDWLLGVQGVRDPESRGGSGAGVGPTEAQLMALSAYQAAVRAVGIRLSWVLVGVCCEEMDVRQLAERRHVDRDRVAGLLSVALDMLGDHYRMPSELIEERIRVGSGTVKLIYRQIGSGFRAEMLGDVPVSIEAEDDRVLVRLARDEAIRLHLAA